MSKEYDSIERPYGTHLERDSDNLIPSTENESSSFGAAGTSEDAAGTMTPGSSGGGSAQDPVIKNEGSLDDIWIKNFIRSTNWQPKSRGFYLDGATGYAEFSNIYITGGITAVTGTIGGWMLAPGELYSGNVHLQSTDERILLGSATAPLVGTGVFIGKDGSDYEMRAGDPVGSYMHWDGSALTLKGGVIQNVGVGTDLSILGWQSNIVFSATDQDTVAWSSGTLSFHNGVNYSISAGNTGNMAALTYIYLDTAVSLTQLQITTTSSSAVGVNKVLIGTAKNNATVNKNATFLGFGGAGGVSTYISTVNIAPSAIDTNELATDAVTADKILANTITAAEIAANTITAAEIAATTITANEIAANTITAAEIAANTITAGEIAANTITAGEIASSTITATQMAAGAITTAKMQVIPGNLLENPTLELGNSGWTLAEASIVNNPAAARSGNYAIEYIVANPGGPNEINNAFIDAEVGDQFYVSAWVQTTSGTGNVSVTVRQYDENKNSLGRAPDAANVSSGAAGSYVQISGLTTVTNAATKYVRFDIGENGSINANPWYFDDMFMSRAVAGVHIEDGAITADKITVTNLAAITADMGTITAGSMSVTSGANTIGFTPAGANAIFSGPTGSPTFKVTPAGVLTATGAVIGGSAISTSSISGIPNDANTDIQLLEATHNLVFSVTDADTIAWSSGTVTLSNGRTFSISAGNTGNMAALTYIYLDPGVSSTVLQTTTTYSTAIGANKRLLGVAQNHTISASFIPYGAGQILIDGQQINANSIVAGNIAAGAITATKIDVSTLSAITADMGAITAGTITLNSSGHIKGGQTAYDTGLGFFLGYSGGDYKLSMGVGGSDDNNLRWDGSKLIVNGYDQTGLGTYGGDGSDGALTCLTGTTTTLNAGQLYQYTSVTIQTGATLTFTGEDIAQILVQNDFDLQAGGVIEMRWITTTYIGGVVGIHALESGNPYKILATTSLGGAAEIFGLGGDGGAGGDGIGAGAGTGGAAGANSGTPTGGGAGTDGTTGSIGGGGGGGGGANVAGGTAPTAGAAGSGVNGGAGGAGGFGAANSTGGNGGSGGGGTDTGNGGVGGDGGYGTNNGNGGDGGNGGDSGPNGGSGGDGGRGGDCDNPAGIYNAGDGGNGGNGYINGGNGGRGGDGDGGATHNSDGGEGGNGGDAFKGTGGNGGHGGGGSDQGRGKNGGRGGDGYIGGDGGDGGDCDNSVGSSSAGNGGDGGDAYSGAIPLFVFAGGNMNLAGTVNAHGGRGGDGGAGGSHKSGTQHPELGGDGGNGGDGADVYLLCKGAFTKTGTILTSAGRGGQPGPGGLRITSSITQIGSAGEAGVPGRSGRAITGSITI